jgi:hypothetical protein
MNTDKTYRRGYGEERRRESSEEDKEKKVKSL